MDEPYSLALGSHVDEPSNNKILNIKTIHITVQRPKFSLGVACSLFCVFVFVFIILQVSSEVVSLETTVPFYDRSSTAMKRQDGLLQGKEDADALAQFGGDDMSERRTPSIEFSVLYMTSNRKGNVFTPDFMQRMVDIEDYILMGDVGEPVPLGGNARAKYRNYCALSGPSLMVNDDYDGEGEIHECLEGSDPSKCLFVPANEDVADDSYCYQWLSPVSLMDPNFFDYYLPYEESSGLGKHVEVTDILETVRNPEISTQSVIDDKLQYWAGFPIEGVLYSSEDYWGSPGAPGANYSVYVSNLMYPTSSSDFGNAVDRSGREKDLHEAVGGRSVFYIGMPLAGYRSESDDKDGQEDEIADFLYDEYDDFMQDASGNGLDVLWNDNERLMYNKEVAKLLPESLMFVLGSILFVWTYLVCMTGSVFLASLGMGQIFMSFFPSLLFYRYVFGYSYFGTLNILSIFIIIGIGVDNIFVFLDAWSQNSVETDTLTRMSVTLRRSGTAMFVTSLTTIIAFFANATSAFPAIYTFGTFSALLVLVNFCAVITFFPTVVAVHHRYLEGRYRNPCEMALGACVSKKSSQDHDVQSLGRVELMFNRVWAPFVHKFRYVILMFFASLLVFCIIVSLNLVPDENTPELLKYENNYRKYTDQLTKYYARADDPMQISVEIVSGIDRSKPIDRSGTDETMEDDKGEVQYATPDRFNCTTPASQVFLVDQCLSVIGGVDSKGQRDLNCAARKVEGCTPDTWHKLPHDDDGLVDLTYDSDYLPQVYSVMKCPMWAFKVWLEDPERGNGQFPCSEENGCNFEQKFREWISDDKPDVSSGRPVYDTWYHYVYLKECRRETSEVTESWDRVCDYIHGDSNDVGSPGEVRFVVSEIRVDEQVPQDYNDGLDLYYEWEDWHTDYLADNCDVDEGCMLQDSYQIAETAWMYYFLNEKLISEVFFGIGLSLVLSFIILNAATGNFIMACLATATISQIVLGVIAFTVIAGWDLGVLEAINFVMVIGLSVDYTVHLSEAYLHGGFETRYERTVGMLTSLGVSVLSGAVSSLGSAFFMFFAPILFFPKFAAFIFCTLSLSLIYSLTFMSAFLFCWGPEGTTGNWKAIIARAKHALFGQKYQQAPATDDLGWD